MMIFSPSFLLRPVRQFSCVLLLCALSTAGSVWASDSGTLSLDEAVRSALLQAPELLARKAGLRAAEAAIGPAGQLPVDAAIVMIENAHKHLEAWQHAHPDQVLEGEARWQLLGVAAAEVGSALFFSLLIITLSFVPVFTLEAQEGRLFAPLPTPRPTQCPPPPPACRSR